jgi:hypothetical protein
MLGRIHPDDHAELAETPVRLEHAPLLFALEHDSEAVQEPIGLLGDLADVGVTHDRIERVEAVRLAVVQSTQLAKLTPLVVGSAALPVCARCDQIESVDVGHSLLRG